MIRGWYTGASGMNAQQNRLDAISNNLANVDTAGYKRDITVSKSFPELLIRRTNADGVYHTSVGSADAAPIIGKLGLGVETNENYTDFTQGSFKITNTNTDAALSGKGFYCVETPQGERYTRNGNFLIGKEGILETKDGYPVLGENGYIYLNDDKISMYLCTSRGIYTNFINDACRKCQSSVSSSIPPLGKYEGEEVYMGVGFFDDEETEKTILQCNDIADTTSWAVGAVDIVPKGASKAKAVKEAAKVYGFDLSETIGFGDGENDIPMLQQCEIGVCMGNGYDSVKEVADYVTDDIDEDGIYNALRHFNII